MINAEFMPSLNYLYDMCYTYRLPIVPEQITYKFNEQLETCGEYVDSPASYGEICTVKEAACFSFNECIKYFPHDFIEFIKQINKFDNFKSDIIDYVIFITQVKIQYNQYRNNSLSSNRIKDSSCYYNSFTDFIDHLSKSSTFEAMEAFDTATYWRKLNLLINQNQYINKLHIMPFKDGGSKHILKWQDAYLFFTLNKSQERPTLYINKSGKKTKFKNVNDFVMKFHCYINQSSEKNKDLSYYFIERDYNFELIKSIVSALKINGLKFDSQIIDVLKHLCLFPNVLGRQYYADIIIKLFKEYSGHGSLDMFTDEFKGDYGFPQFLRNSTPGTKLIMQHIQKIILHMSYISIPLIENYTYYIIHQFDLASKDNFDTTTKYNKLNHKVQDNFKDNYGFNQVSNIIYDFSESLLNGNFNKQSLFTLNISEDEHLELINNALLQKIDILYDETTQ